MSYGFKVYQQMMLYRYVKTRQTELMLVCATLRLYMSNIWNLWCARKIIFIFNKSEHNDSSLKTTCILNCQILRYNEYLSCVSCYITY